MQVLMTADTVGGVWTYALELARALQTHDVRVFLATMGAPLSPAQWDEARAVTNLEVLESRFKLEWMTEPWGDVKLAGEWLIDLQEKLRPDVVHLNGYAHGALSWRAPVLMVAHSDVLSWWRAVKGEEAPAEWKQYREEVGRGLQGADLVAAPTRAMLDALEQFYDLPRETRVIFNGRDAAHWGPQPKEPFILAAGRLWDEAKNVAALEAVAPRLPWPVCVAGSDEHPANQGADAGRAHSKPLKMLGRLSETELQSAMGRAAIYALPARYEPFGLSVLEAALCGCALVLGDIPSLREVWGDGALFVAPDDTDALEANLRCLIANEGLRQSLAQRSRERALFYTPQRMARHTMAAYRHLLRAAT